MKIYAVTGHRPEKLGGYLFEAEERRLKLARAYFTADRPDQIITGMALGWDTAVALAAVDLGIPFIAAVPFKGQEGQWFPNAQKRYRDLLRAACDVVVVSAGGFTAEKMMIRNEWMVDRADKVIALWDGSPGGSGNCACYAMRRGVQVVNLYKFWVKGL